MLGTPFPVLNFFAGCSFSASILSRTSSKLPLNDLPPLEQALLLENITRWLGPFGEF